jgi:hypothetical protein
MSVFLILEEMCFPEAACRQGLVLSRDATPGLTCVKPKAAPACPDTPDEFGHHFADEQFVFGEYASIEASNPESRNSL